MHPPLTNLPEILKKFPLIQAAYIFGSIAAGKKRSGSDLDLAILTWRSFLDHPKFTTSASISCRRLQRQVSAL